MIDKKSHLSTIIQRVKGRLTFQNREEDAIFEQAVINLMEYLGAWNDATKEEISKAIELYDKYRPELTGRGMPSHKARLKEADKLRLNLIKNGLTTKPFMVRK